MYGDLLKTSNGILHDDKNRIVFEMGTSNVNKQKKTFIVNLFLVVNIIQPSSDYHYHYIHQQLRLFH
jgi:hypothetical protein